MNFYSLTMLINSTKISNIAPHWATGFRRLDLQGTATLCHTVQGFFYALPFIMVAGVMESLTAQAVLVGSLLNHCIPLPPKSLAALFGSLTTNKGHKLMASHTQFSPSHSMKVSKWNTQYKLTKQAFLTLDYTPIRILLIGHCLTIFFHGKKIQKLKNSTVKCG